MNLQIIIRKTESVVAVGCSALLGHSFWWYLKFGMNKLCVNAGNPLNLPSDDKFRASRGYNKQITIFSSGVTFNQGVASKNSAIYSHLVPGMFRNARELCAPRNALACKTLTKLLLMERRCCLYGI